MILVDSSVFIARFKAEPGWEALTAPIGSEPYVVPASVLVEVGMRVRTLAGLRRGASPTDAAADMHLALRGVREGAADILPIDADIAVAATETFAAYGKGTVHPARLNFGDCLVHAVAKRSGLPLLFEGDDFRHTDLDLHPASQDGAGRTLGD